MGFGDEIIATGFARGAAARGRRVAFGDGRRIVWSPWSAEIFRNNPNVAPPGSESFRDIEWCGFYKGNRVYNRPGGNGWLWNYDFRPKPGEFFFSDAELAAVEHVPRGIVLVEPNVPNEKPVAVNKRWGKDRFQSVVDALRGQGHVCVQLEHPGTTARLAGVLRVSTTSFRNAAAVLGRAKLFVGNEGGMHHAAAALGVPAVVIFGGFIPAQVTGYDGHVNLTGDEPPCGSTRPCSHCRRALDAIVPDEAIAAAAEILDGGTIQAARRAGERARLEARGRAGSIQRPDAQSSAGELPGA